jgi:diguanylate cyclase
MNAVAHARRATARLFAVYAVISLIPIAALGFILAADFRSEAQQRGIDQARSEAQVIAQTAVEPLLDGAPLSAGLTTADRTSMRRLVRQTVDRSGEGALRLRLRDQTGHIVFSDDGTGFDDPVDHEALDAAHGEKVAILTHLNTDATPRHPGPRAV